jgi:hypothetical protein
VWTLLLLIGNPASAHLLNMTKVEARVASSGDVTVHVQIDLTRAAGGASEYYEISHAASPDARLAPLLERLIAAIAIQAGDRKIALHRVGLKLPRQSREEFLNPLSWPMTELDLAGSLPAGTTATSLQGLLASSFPFEEPIELTFASVAEDRTMTRWLVAGQTSPSFALRAAVAAAPPTPTSVAALAQYSVFGFTHILPKGLDHVLFVVGLYLGARSFRTLLVLVTCFTLAHSITLGLATLGIVRVPANIVEPLIAASIAWIAVENLWIATARYRPFVVFGFGLLHGMGFASALRELKLPQGDFLLSLVSFNLGIEFGQLVVVAMAMLLTWRFRNRLWYRKRIVVPLSLAIAAVALVWTVQRVLQ